jgi:hypothetical protein
LKLKKRDSLPGTPQVSGGARSSSPTRTIANTMPATTCQHKHTATAHKSTPTRRCPIKPNLIAQKFKNENKKYL